MANLQYDVQLQWGRVFCVDRSSHEITSIVVRELDVEPWVYDECSEEAIAILKGNKLSSTC